ncbi:MAG: hypothetical protein IJI92_04655 [Erysipelotrichaceae bacterium]|nr:hypothetical protein [Erysipelotrichaceae bacterium]
MANIRSAYAVVQAAVLTEDDDTTIKLNNVTGISSFEKTTDGYKGTVTLKQKEDGWKTTPALPGDVSGTPKADGTAVIEYKASTGKTTISFS